MEDYFVTKHLELLFSVISTFQQILHFSIRGFSILKEKAAQTPHQFPSIAPIPTPSPLALQKHVDHIIGKK